MEQHKWITEEYQAAGRYLAHLIQCVLNGTQAEEKPDDFTWGLLYRIAMENHVEGICYFGMRELEKKPPEPLAKLWKDTWNTTIYRQFNFEWERSLIFAEMEKKGIAYLPLKGIHLAEYYPEPGMRAMADNDILYGLVEKNPDGEWQIEGSDEAEREESLRKAQNYLVDIMKKHGYQVESLIGHHDNYTKEPMFHFEMHRALMSKGTPLYHYYKNPWKRAVPSEENPYAFRYKDEDEYIYILAHAFKHFESAGCGIRCAVDEYVFLQEKSERMDWTYIKRELEKAGLTEFERKLHRLSVAAFGPDRKLGGEEEQLLYYMLGCGMFGNMNVYAENGMEKLRKDGNDLRQAKWKYIWSRIFLSKEACEGIYPFFARHRAFLPLLVIYRVCRGIFKRRKILLQEWKTVQRMK